MSELAWSIDSLIVRGGVLFGFGWVFHPEKPIVALNFKLFSSEKDMLGHIRAEHGKPREDVGHIFSDQPVAVNSGFVVYGAVPRWTGLESILLECTLADGSIIDLSVPHPSVINFGDADEADKNRLMLRQFAVFFKRGLHLVRTRKFTSLFEKIRRYLRGRPKTVLQNPSELALLLKHQQCENLSLILDHDLGGGANLYRNQLVDSLVHEGRTALILTYHVATLTHMVVLRNSRINTRYAIPGMSFLLDAVVSLNVKEIVYNTGVSFIQPEDIPQFLIALKAKTSARLKVLVHDYFLVCPSHFLLDYEGKFCRIPDLDVCVGCLPQNSQGFTTLFAARDMHKWRSIWGALLVSADEIVTFSENSAKLLRKAYPLIETNRISITPHKVEHLSSATVHIKNTDSLCIGVVGMIGFHKGAQLVKALANEIKSRGASTKIVVIGAIEANCEPGVVQQTGPYKHEDLPRLIEDSGANVMLFPSICPETFSYVVHELVDLQLPVASFDFGAPAERLSSYSKGLVLSSMYPASILDELISFHHKIYLAN